MIQMQPTLDNLIKQLELELTASHIYLQMHIWCEIDNYKGFAKYMLRASDEERGHAMIVKDYLNDFASSFPIKIIIPAINITTGFSPVYSILSMMEEVLQLEIKVTETINITISEALIAGDYATAKVFEALAEEQIKGLTEVNYILDKIKRCGDNQAAIMLLDKEVGEIK